MVPDIIKPDEASWLVVILFSSVTFIVSGVIGGAVFIRSMIWLKRECIDPIGKIYNVVMPNGGKSPMDRILYAVQIVELMEQQINTFIEGQNGLRGRIESAERAIFHMKGNIAIIVRQVELLHENANHAAWRTDKNGQCQWINSKWSELTGLSLAQAGGNGWVEGLAPEDRERVFAEFSLCIERRTPLSTQFHMIDRKGNKTRVSCKGFPVMDPDSSEPLAWIGTNIVIADPIQPAEGDN
jgi:PAS domain S-box-containing protein